MPNAAFTRINEHLAKLGQELLKNPRNATAGTLKQLDPKVTASPRLSFFAHGLGEVAPQITDDYWEWLSLLKDWGLAATPHASLAHTIDEVLAAIDAFARSAPPFPFRPMAWWSRCAPSNSVQPSAKPARARAGSIAYKYPAEQVRDGAQGGHLAGGQGREPHAGRRVGAGLRRPAPRLQRDAAQHRSDPASGYRIGDTVVIERAGEVIPYVVAAIEKRPGAGSRSRCRRSVPPAAPVEKEEGTPYIRCDNPACPDQLKERLRWFCGRNQMNVEHLGESLIDQWWMPNW